MHRARFFTPSICLLALLAAGAAGRVDAEEYVKSYPVSGRADVHVKADDGAVRVRPSSSAEVEFRVTYEGYTLGDSLTLESRQEGNRVELTERVYPSVGLMSGRRNRRVIIEVRAPKDSDLRLETGDGGVQVSSINGVVNVRTGDGAIDVTALSGKVDLRTGDGAIRAERVKGDLQLRTVDGAIYATDLDGKCYAWTGDGQVRLDGRFEELNVQSGDGGVIARVARGSVVSVPWSIRTSDGSVEVSLPESLKADIDIATNDGGISLHAPVSVQGEIGNRRVRGAMNGGGPALRIRTSDGSVRVRSSE